MLIQNKLKSAVMRFFGIVIISFCFLLLQKGDAFAGFLVELSPASGSYSSDFTVDLVFDANGMTTYGLAIDLTYTDGVEFTSVSKGDFDCGFEFDAIESVDGTINFKCTESGTDPLTSGVLAHFVFSPTATGTVTMTLSNPTPDDADAMDGGVYTIVGGTGGTLPRTAIFDSSTIFIVSALLLGFGLYIGAKNSGMFRRKKFEERFNSMYSKL